MSEITSSSADNSDKTPERLAAEKRIEGRLQTSTWLQRAGVALGTILGAGAGLSTQAELPTGVTNALIIAIAPVTGARYLERRGARNFCDRTVLNYQLARSDNPNNALSADEYAHHITDQVLTTTTVRPDDDGGFTVDKKIDRLAITSSPSVWENAAPAMAATGGLMAALVLSGESVQASVRIPFGMMATVALATGVIASEIDKPTRDIAPYMRQLDNIDGGGSLQMEMLPPPPAE